MVTKQKQETKTDKTVKAVESIAKPQITKKSKQPKITEDFISTRGREFVGKVVSTKATKTATVVWQTRIYIPKYQRYETRLSRVKAHNPETINAKEGDTVKIKETRPLSKTKNFIVIEVIKQ